MLSFARRVLQPTVTIADRMRDRTNNFDVLRLLAALLVLWSHSYPLAGEPRELFARLTRYDTGGGFGVAIFFTISGFLVVRSLTERRLSEYVQSRVARIVPGLAAMSLLTVLVLGPLFTTLPLKEYFAHGQTWRHLTNFLVFRLEYGLPGVFAGLPAPGAVNGSLWTLPVECGFYVLLPILAIAGWHHPRAAFGMTFLVAAAYLLSQKMGLGWGNQGPQLWPGTSAYSALRWGAIFLIGACMWLWRASIPLSGWLATACLIVMVLAARTPAATLAFMLCVPYLVIYLALGVPVLRHPPADLSYGTYIYAESPRVS